jgi:hypothetical protein
MGLQTFHGKGPHLLLWSGPQAARGKVTVRGTPNCLNYWVIFLVRTQFTNVAVDLIIQTGGPRVEDPWSVPTTQQLKIHCINRCLL